MTKRRLFAAIPSGEHYGLRSHRDGRAAPCDAAYADSGYSGCCTCCYRPRGRSYCCLRPWKRCRLGENRTDVLFRCFPFLFTSMSKLAMQSWCQHSSMQAYDKYVQIRKVPDWYWRMASNYRAVARPATALSFGFLFSSEVGEHILTHRQSLGSACMSRS